MSSNIEHERRMRKVGAAVQETAHKDNFQSPSVSAVARHMGMTPGALYTFLGRYGRDGKAELDRAWLRAGYRRSHAVGGAHPRHPRNKLGRVPEEDYNKEHGTMKTTKKTRRVSDAWREQSALAWSRVDDLLRAGLTDTELSDAMSYASVKGFTSAHAERALLSVAKRETVALLHREHAAQDVTAQSPETPEPDHAQMSVSKVWEDVADAGRILAEALAAARDVTPSVMLSEDFHSWESTASDILTKLDR